MSCTVAWTTPARDKSARLWISLWIHDVAKALRFTAALNKMEQQLRDTPLAGHRRQTEFVLREDPVEIVYTYSPRDALVTIRDIELLSP
jgi:hypothetical protein